MLKSSIPSCWQALRLDLFRHACCRRRPIHNAYQTHSKLINTIDAGVRIQESMSIHITDLIVGAKESKNAPLSFTEQATHEECQGIYTILSAYAPSTPQD